MLSVVASCVARLAFIFETDLIQMLLLHFWDPLEMLGLKTGTSQKQWLVVLDNLVT